MSCRFAGANSPDEFWEVLSQGKDGIIPLPAGRPQGFRPGMAQKKELLAGFLKCPIDEFDAKFFGISPREAPFVDPQQRILLEVTWESLEDAGINPQNLKESDTGVFMGIWQQDYDHMIPGGGLTANDFHHRYLGNALSATASRISYFLGLNGPNLALERYNARTRYSRFQFISSNPQLNGDVFCWFHSAVVAPLPSELSMLAVRVCAVERRALPLPAA